MRLRPLYLVGGGLFVFLVLPAVWLASTHPTVKCAINNLMQVDPAAEAAAQITEIGPGVLDFHLLSQNYDRICNAFVGSGIGIAGNIEATHKEVGRRICGG